MKCPNCGNELNDDAKFCVECGMPITEPAAPEPQSAEAPEPETAAAPEEQPAGAESPLETEKQIPEEPAPVAEPGKPAEQEKEAGANGPAELPPAESRKEPVTVVSGTDSRLLLTSAQYFFLILLFHIPVIGLIFLFVWGLGRPKNLSLKRFSLAVLILRLLGWLFMLLFAVALLLGFSGLIPGFKFQPGTVPWVG